MKKIISMVLIICILCSSFSSCAFIKPLDSSKITVGEWFEMLCTTFGMVEPVNSDFENNLETAKIWNIISSDFTAKEDEEIVAAFASETLLNVFEFDEKEQEKINDILGFTSRRKGLDKVDEKTAKAAIEYAHYCWANYAPKSRSNYEVSERTLEISADAIEEANESKGTVLISSTFSNQDYVFLDEEIWENSGRVFVIDKSASYDGNIVAKQISEEIELEKVFDKVDTAGTVKAKVSDIFAYDANGNKMHVEYDTGISNLSATEIPAVISLNTMGRAVSSGGKSFRIPLGTKIKLIGEIEGSKVDFAVEYEGKSSKDIGMSAFAAVDFGDVSYEYISEEKYVYLKTDFDIRYGFSSNGAKMVLPENVSKDILSGSKSIKEAIKELEDIYNSPFSDMLDEFDASPSVDKEKYSIALVEVPLYTDGINSVTVKLSIFLKIDGTIEIETVMDENVIGVEYRKGAGIRPIFDFSEPKTEIELDLSARVGLGVGLFYKVINYPIVDCTFDFGVDAECSGKIIDLSGTYFCGAVSLPKHAFEELSKYGYFTDDGTIHSCVDVNCGIFLDFSIGENSLLGKVKSTSWTLINPRKATIYSTHADDRKTVEKCIFEDIGGVENYEPTEVDFEKLDEWFRQRWEEENDIQHLKIPVVRSDDLYYYKCGCTGYGCNQKVWKYNLRSNTTEKIDDALFLYADTPYSNAHTVKIGNTLFYYTNEIDEENGNTGVSKIFKSDIDTDEIKEIYVTNGYVICGIGAIENKYILLVVQDFKDYDGFISFPHWYYPEYTILMDLDGNIIYDKNDLLKICTTVNAGYFGEIFITDGEDTYYSDQRELYKITGSMQKKVIANSDQGCEIATVTEKQVYYTSSTMTQFCPSEITYVRYYDKYTKENHDTGIDVYFNNYKMLGVLTVIDEMIYAVYTNIPLHYENYDDFLWDYHHKGHVEEDFPQSEGYCFYLYRYNMETGEYTLVAQ